MFLFLLITVFWIVLFIKTRVEMAINHQNYRALSYLDFFSKQNSIFENYFNYENEINK